MACASRGWLHGALLVSGCLLLAPGALAEADVREPAVPEQSGPAGEGPEQSAWLRWHGPIECQNTREVERQLESLLGYAPAREQLPLTRVEVGWGSARGWSLLISVSLGQGERRREVVVRTCADGFDVVALTLALILDPELGGDGELGLEPPSDSSALQAASVEEGSESPSDVAAAPVLPAAAAPPEPADAVGEPGPPPLPLRAGRPALRISGGGRADLGTLPATLLGAGVSLSLSGWHWRIDAGAGYLGRATQTLPLAVNEVSYTNVFGLLRGCRELNPRAGGHFDLCAGGQLGSLAVNELGGERRRGRGLWAAAMVGAELGLELSESWSAFSGVELVFPLARHELGLASGEVVYELPAISVQLTLGAVWRVTELASP